MVPATEEDVLSAAGRLSVARRRSRSGGRVWKQHSEKAGKRCRCAPCNADRDRESDWRDPVQVSRQVSGVEGQVPGAPDPPPREQKTAPRSFAVRSTWLR